MTDLLTSGIVNGIFGLSGVLVGSFITILGESRRLRRQETKEKQKQVIDHIEKIQEDASAVLLVFDAIQLFIDMDFDGNKSDFEKVEAIAKFASINLPTVGQSLQDMRKTIYLLFPKTLNNRYFEYFDSLFRDIDRITHATSLDDDLDKMQQILSEKFRNDFIRAQYLMLTFDEELKAIMSGSGKVDQQRSREFYRWNKGKMRQRTQQ
ncbi:MAG: hypothetical protein IMZ61_05095 [Planctomycetes bacterium]|nr:hypothetical protein [Planctomycetota bacterium]